MNFHFPVLPERLAKHSKIASHLNEMTGTRTSFEVQQAIQEGYTFIDVYEQHHFTDRSNELFQEYNAAFFAIKRRAKEEGNKGLEAIVKLCINGPTGKMGIQSGETQIHKASDGMWRILLLFV